MRVHCEWCGDILVRAVLVRDVPPRSWSKVLPYEDSIYILKHGKKAYRAMKRAVDSTAGADSAPPSPNV